MPVLELDYISQRARRPATRGVKGMLGFVVLEEVGAVIELQIVMGRTRKFGACSLL